VFIRRALSEYAGWMPTLASIAIVHSLFVLQSVRRTLEFQILEISLDCAKQWQEVKKIPFSVEVVLCVFIKWSIKVEI